MRWSAVLLLALFFLYLRTKRQRVPSVDTWAHPPDCVCTPCGENGTGQHAMRDARGDYRTFRKLIALRTGRSA